jgi:hypothetical protein
MTIGPPWRHRELVWAVSCSPKEKKVVTGSEDKTARLWQIPEPAVGDPERITLWVQVITGLELDDNGAVHRLDADTWKQRRQQLRGLGGPPVP